MRAFIFDTETTGLVDCRSLPLPKQPYITEVYGTLIDLDTGEMIEEYQTLIKPPKPIPEEITKITGIDDATVANAPAFANIAPALRKHIEQAPTIIAHNLSFDAEMLELEYARLPDPSPLAFPRLLCTVEQTVHIQGFRLSLTALHHHLFGEPFPSAHRAKPDVIALVRCCLELRRRDML